MSAPQFILETHTATNATSPKSMAPINFLAGDVLVAYALTALDTATIAITNSGVVLPWVQQQVILSTGFGWVSMWTCVATAARTSVTFTLTRTGTATVFYGGSVMVFRGSTGVGASSQATNASGAPSLALTTTDWHSLIVFASTDSAVVDGTSRAWRTGAGALTEVTYFTSVGQFTAYGGFHPNAGAPAAYTLGLSTPAGQKYAAAAVEIKGQVPPNIHAPSFMLPRS